jgi:hypothetical protein
VTGGENKSGAPGSLSNHLLTQSFPTLLQFRVSSIRAGVLATEAVSSPTRHLAVGPSFRAAMSLRRRTSHDLPQLVTGGGGGGQATTLSLRHRTSSEALIGQKPSGELMSPLGPLEGRGPLSAGAVNQQRPDLGAVMEEDGLAVEGTYTPALRTISGLLSGISGLGDVVSRSKLTSMRRRTEDYEVSDGPYPRYHRPDCC